MHIFNMSTTSMQGFKKIHLKLWEELITQFYTVKRDEQMDSQTDRQGQILMPPDYRHGVIK